MSVPDEDSGVPEGGRGDRVSGVAGWGSEAARSMFGTARDRSILTTAPSGSRPSGPHAGVMHHDPTPQRRRLSTIVLAGTLTATACQDEPSADSLQADELLVEAIRETLVSPETPETGLRHYQERLDELLEEEPDLERRHRITTLSQLAALRDGDDLQALETLTERVHGKVYDAPTASGDTYDTSPREAWTGVCRDDGVKNVVYHVNGIGTHIFAALDNMHELDEAVRAVSPGFDGEFRLFYNASGDTHEMACNELGLQLTMSWVGEQEKARLEALGRQHCMDTGVFADLGESIAQLTAPFISRHLFDLGSAGTEPELTRAFRDVVTNDVMSGKNAIVVAHSQGNMFARLLALDLAGSNVPGDPTRPLRSIGMIATASPASYGVVSDELGYFELVQLSGDIVTLVPGSPAPNHRIALSNEVDAALQAAAFDVLHLARAYLTQDPRTGVVALARLLISLGSATWDMWRIHGFVASYLGDENRTTVAGAVVNASQQLVNERELAGQGEFQVMLGWDVPGDIDLHVTEPDGTHVYYGNRLGTTGQLDRDDLVGTGPENFYVCDRESIAAGEYQVSVNNFGGASGTRAKVYVRAGDQLQSFETTLGAANAGQTLIELLTVAYDGQSFTISDE